MTAYILISITLFALAAAAHAATPAETLSRTVTATHKCQKDIGQKPTPFKWRKHGRGYRLWQIERWQQRLETCRQWNWKAFLSPVERAVLLCETDMNWQHNSGTYQGAPGFYHGSWDAFKPAGYPAEAYQATPWEQTVVMRRIRDRFGWSGWGCYTHGGYRSHL